MMAVLRRIDMYNLHPADLIPDAGAMQRFMELTQLYDAAIREVRTKLEILDTSKAERSEPG